MRLYSSQPSILNTELQDDAGALLYCISSADTSITTISKLGLKLDSQDSNNTVAILNWSGPIPTIDFRGQVFDYDAFFILSFPSEWRFKANSGKIYVWSRVGSRWRLQTPLTIEADEPRIVATWYNKRKSIIAWLGRKKRAYLEIDDAVSEDLADIMVPYVFLLGKEHLWSTISVNEHLRASNLERTAGVPNASARHGKRHHTVDEGHEEKSGQEHEPSSATAANGGIDSDGEGGSEIVVDGEEGAYD